MECLQCGTPLAPLRYLNGGEFCSDDHRLEHAVAACSANDLLPFARPAPADSWIPLAPAALPDFIAFAIRCSVPELAAPAESSPWDLPEAGLVAWSALPAAAAPAPDTFEVSNKRSRTTALFPAARLALFTPALIPRRVGALEKVGAFGARNWKIFASLIPVVVAALLNHSQALSGSLTGDKGIFAGIHHSLRARAAILFADDFRSGLDDWQGSTSLASSWTFDKAGFVRPTALAAYRPTMALKDYDIEFLSQIEQKGLGIAFRIVDWKHYYAVKLLVSKAGLIPVMDVVHYVVDNGREVGRVTRRVPLNARNETSLYRARLDIHGNSFTLISKGRIVDDWTDDRYPRGGVGFFCGKGERARLRWVEVSHQNDTIGRFCAFLAPDDGRNKMGAGNQP